MSEEQIQWHALSEEEVLQRLESDPERGLADGEASARLERFGRNELRQSGGKGPLAILWDQITNPMVLLLLAAAAISLLLGKIIDASAVLAIVVLNAILGFVQEYRAERAIAALKRLSTPLVRVRRSGRVIEIASPELVPGDIVLVEAGNAIPADARLLEAANLRLQEATLTGESLAVDKHPGALRGENVPLGDRYNMLFMGTAVTYGRGVAVVTQTGMETELGHIAGLIQTVHGEQTPLQRRIAQLGRILAFSVVAIVAIAYLLGLLRGEHPVEMFQTAVSMAVAAVPEGLPAVVTIVLALGAQRMLHRKALIRKLPAVETLGSVTTICSDKTGTLTENRMTVTVLDVAGHTLNLSEVLRHGRPVLTGDEEPIIPQWPAHALLLSAGMLCNDALIEPVSAGGHDLKAIGDPTEGALLVAGGRLGLEQARLKQHLPRIGEVPFSSERRRMSTLHRLAAQPGEIDALEQVITGLFNDTQRWVLLVKGGVDGLLDRSPWVWSEGQVLALDAGWRSRIEDANHRLAQEGLRVLGIAYRSFSGEQPPVIDEHSEDDLVLVGLVGMMDPPRAEVEAAVQVCQTAGIRPVMITGDHPLTALQIARMLRIVPDETGRVLTGADLNRMSPEELEAVVEEVSVYARVSPEHKLNIVQALQRRGQVVAMTGDGVNDAPALRKSNIGVAMGITGTDVSKEAASMVLLDDNFATIVGAVEEGRRVYENVRKFIRYTLGSNAGEILVMFIAPFIGMPLPLTPLQILWMNLITDGFPGLALTSEQPERDIMRRPPVHPEENIFGRGVGSYILRTGVVMALITLAFGYWAWSSGNPTWETMVFSLLIFLQGGHALAIRSERDSLFHMGLRSNPSVAVAVLATVLLQLAAIYWAPLQKLFGTLPLSAGDLGITLLAGLGVFAWVELEKWLRRRRER